MRLLLDSFWRAVAYSLMPRVLFLSFVPLLLMVAVTWGLGYFYWAQAIEWVRATLESFSLLAAFGRVLDIMGLAQLKSVLSSLLVIATVTPVIVIASLLAVTVLMTPVIVNMVGRRRFPGLARRATGGWWRSVGWALASTLIALVISVPLWGIPMLVFVVPPLIWGWLTYRILAYDALAAHATVEERKAIFRTHRWSLLFMGLVTGALASSPNLIWVSGPMIATAFVVLVPIAVWIYTAVFVFSSLWFVHYSLAALHGLRAGVDAAVLLESEPAP